MPHDKEMQPPPELTSIFADTKKTYTNINSAQIDANTDMHYRHTDTDTLTQTGSDTYSRHTTDVSKAPVMCLTYHTCRSCVAVHTYPQVWQLKADV